MNDEAKTGGNRPSPLREPPGVCKIERDGAGRLVLHPDDGSGVVNDVHLARYFPWSVPDLFISVRNADGREVAMIRGLDKLDPETRYVVTTELSEKVFNPKITRVLDHKREFGMTTITADTDRGRVTFRMRGRSDVRILSAERALFRDIEGSTYEVPDYSKLDPSSRALMHQYF